MDFRIRGNDGHRLRPLHFIIPPTFAGMTVGLFCGGGTAAGRGPPYSGGIVVMSPATNSIAITRASSRPSRAG